MSPSTPDDFLSGRDRLLKPKQVAEMFRVDPRTVARWSRPGRDGDPPRLRSVRTMGGHRRYSEREVREMLRAEIEGGGDDGTS